MSITDEPLTVSGLMAWLEKVREEHGDLPFFLHDDYGECEIKRPIFEVASPKPKEGCYTLPKRVRIMAKVDQAWLDANRGE